MGPSLDKAPWLPAAILVVMTFAAYSHALQCGWIWDDDSYVTANPLLTEPGGLQRIWLEPRASPQYYPLVFTSFWLETQLWGIAPAGFHATNILLHALVAVFWWRLLRRLGLPGAWMAAAVYALHPVHVESVAWITERKNVLSAVFYLASLLAWLRFSPLQEVRFSERRQWNWYITALLLFAAALMSKTVTATLPAVILLGLWWKRGSLRAIGRRDGIALLPMFLAAIGFGIMTILVERHHVGAEGVEWNYTFIERCLIAGRIPWFYAWKLLWPGDLIFIYPRWVIDAAAWRQWLFPLGLVGLIVSLWVLRHRIGRGPLTAVLFFIGTLFPALGFFNVYPMRFSFVADHFQYLASMGLIALAAGCLATLEARHRTAAAVVSAVLLLGLGVRTWAQTHHYQDTTKLWQHTYERNSKAWIACANLGAELHRKGQLAEALSLYGRAIELKDDLPEVHRNIGEALLAMNDPIRAVPHLLRSLQLTYNSSTVATLGVAIDRIEAIDPSRAIELYKVLIDLRSDDDVMHQKLARLLAARGDSLESIRHFKESVKIKPNDFAYRYNLSLTLARTGALDEAMQHAQAALAIRPESEQVRALIAEIEHLKSPPPAQSLQE